MEVNLKWRKGVNLCGIYITEETEDSNDSKVFKRIPAICRALELETLTLPQMIDKFDKIDIEFK